MAIVPKKKRSISKKKIRHAAWQTEKIKYWTNKINIVTSKDSGKKKLAHRVCPETGIYRGKQIFTVKTKSEDNVVDAE